MNISLGLFGALCSCARIRPNREDTQQANTIERSPSKVSFPLSSYIEESETGASMISPKKSNQGQFIGNSCYIRKSPGAALQEKFRKLDLVTAIQEEQSDNTSNNESQNLIQNHRSGLQHDLELTGSFNCLQLQDELGDLKLSDSPLLSNIDDAQLMNYETSNTFDKIRLIEILSPGRQNSGIYEEFNDYFIPDQDLDKVNDSLIDEDMINNEFNPIEQGSLTLQELKYIIKKSNSIGGMRRLSYIFKQERRACSNDEKLYLEVFLKFSKFLEDQQEENLSFLFTQFFKFDRASYQQALLHYHSEISDIDFAAGLFEHSMTAESLTYELAKDIENEIEEYILNQWSKNSDYYKSNSDIQLQVEQLLKLLRCKAEDYIFKKYGIEIEQLYNFLNKFQSEECYESGSQSSEDRKSLGKYNLRNTAARLLERLSMHTIDEVDESIDSVSQKSSN